MPLDQVKAEVTAKKAYLVDVREQKEWDRGISPALCCCL